MEIIDLTHTLTEDIPAYPGKTLLSKTQQSNYEKGSCVFDMTLSGGLGTHIDASRHFCKGGVGIEAIPLDRCHGPGCILHLSDQVGDNADYAISADDIEARESRHGEIPSGAIVLAHTGWDKRWDGGNFCSPGEQGVVHYPGFSAEAGELLLKRKPFVVGIDTVALDIGAQSYHPFHRLLLGADVCLVENLANLDQLPPTGAHIWMAPMKVQGMPEAPVRAFAIL